jgi:hypothetical protein
MTKQFFPNLSKNYIEILEDDEYYDITIEVGEDPNVKIFRAHILSCIIVLLFYDEFYLPTKRMIMAFWLTLSCQIFHQIFFKLF